MGKKMMKSAAIVALMGTCFACNSCNLGGLGGVGKWFWGIVASAVPYLGYEFLLDDDGVFDLFEDDGNNVAGQ